MLDCCGPMGEAAVLEVQDWEGAGDLLPVLVLLGSELHQPPLGLSVLICKGTGVVTAFKAPSSVNTLCMQGQGGCS